MAPSRFELGADLFEGDLHVGAAGAVFDGDAHETVEQDVAGIEVLGVVGFDAVFEDGGAAQAELGGDGGGLADVVGLDGALGDEVVGAAGEGVAGEVFELADLVAAAAHAGEIVALDVDGGAAEDAGEVGKVLDGGGGLAEFDAGEAGEIHAAPVWLMVPGMECAYVSLVNGLVWYGDTYGRSARGIGRCRGV